MNSMISQMQHLYPRVAPADIRDSKRNESLVQTVCIYRGNFMQSPCHLAATQHNCAATTES